MCCSQVRYGRLKSVIFWLVMLASLRCAAADVPRFAFAVNSFNNTISQFVVEDATGRFIPNGLAPVEQFPSAILVHPSNKYVFALAQASAKLHVYFLDNTTGRLHEAPGSPVATGVASPFALGLGPGGRFIYVAGRLSHNIMGFAFDAENGQVKPIDDMPVTTGGQRARQLVVHPSGRFLYSVNTYSDTVSAFLIDQETGALKLINGSPYPVGQAPVDVLVNMADIPEGVTQAPYNIHVHPSGDYVVVCNWMSASVSVFKVNQSTGSLSLVEGSPFRSLPHPYDLAISPDGTYLYSVHWGAANNNIVGFKFDPQSGKLSRLQTGKFDTYGQGPVDLWFDPTQNLLFVTHYFSHNITSYRFDPGTGALSFVNLTPTRFGPRAFGVSFGDKSVRISSGYVYGISARHKTLFAYHADQEAGGLQLVSKVNLDAEPVSLAYDGANDLVYVATRNPDQIHVHALRNGNTLEPQIEAPVALKETPNSIAVDDNGLLIYTVSAQHDRMAVFERHPETGAIKEWPESPRSTDSYPTQVKIDPAGRFAFVLNEKSNLIGSYRYRAGIWPLIDKVEMPREFGVTDSRFTAFTTDPMGNYIYFADGNNNQIFVYWINLGTGVFEDAKETGYKVDKGPRDLVFHPSGKWLYVLNGKSSTINTFSVDNLWGKLTKKLQTQKTGKPPKRLIMDASGRFAYLIYEDSEKISVFDVDQTSGLLSHRSDVQYETEISDVVVDRILE